MKIPLNKKYILVAIALIFTVFVFFFIPAKQSKYKVIVDENYFRETTTHILYFDNDKDNKPEKIIYKEWNSPQAIELDTYDHDNKLIATSLIPKQKSPAYNNLPYVFKYNNNGNKKIAFLSEKKDSIFLNIFGNRKQSDKIYIDKIKNSEKSNSFSYEFITALDINNDEYNELYFYISEGFNLHPRKLYCVDITNKKILYKTPELGAYPKSVITLKTSNGLQFVMGTQASGFYKNDSIVELSDRKSYLLFFDKQLHRIKSPIELAGEYSFVQVFNLENRKDNRIAVFVSQLEENNYLPAIFILDKSLSIVKKYKLKNRMHAYDESIYLAYFNNEPCICFTSDKNDLVQFKLKHKVEKIKKLKGMKIPIFVKQDDLTKDGENEFLFRDLNSNLYAIYDNELKNPSFFTIPIKQVPLTNCKQFYLKNEGCFICEGKNSSIKLTYKYHKNYWSWNILHFILIFSVFIIVIYIIQEIGNYFLKEQMAMKKQIMELQYQNIKNQMDPHFTLNTLNLVSNSILNDDKHTAYDNFTQFTRLIHRMLSDTTAKLRSLKEEIDFTENYLSIQKNRFGGNFLYTFNIEAGIDLKILVPPLVIQSYVENSIKYGICNISIGEINITIKGSKKFIIIEILDNGVGIKASEKLSEKSTGMGNMLMNKFYDLLSYDNIQRISCKTENVKKDKALCGTRVTIKIPNNLKQI